MHVLVIPQGSYKDSLNPLQTVFEEVQIEVLAESVAQIGVLSAGFWTRRAILTRRRYPHYEIENGIPVLRCIKRAIYPARWRHPLKVARANYSSLKPLIQEYVRAHGKPDVVHAHNLKWGGLLARLIRDDFSIPYVVTEHTSTYALHPQIAMQDAGILADAFQGASAVLAVGNRLANSLELALRDVAETPIEVVPNVVDRRFFDKPFTRRNQDFTVIGIGNLIPTKDFSLLIRAFAKAALPSSSRLLIAGTGPELRNLRREVRALGLNDRVQFVGFVPHARIPDLLAHADLLAHPSRRESFGVVVIEALAMGVPVLATVCGGPEDIVTSEVGRLTNVGNLDGFADGLSYMFEHRHHFHSTAIRDYCKEQYGPDAFADKIQEVYRRVAS